MSDPFDDALAQAEAEEAAARQAAVARKAAEEVKIEAKHTSLRAQLDDLKAVILTKETVFAARGFKLTDSIDKRRFYYGLLLSGGRKRIAIESKASGAAELSVYWDGMRDDDGWQVIIKSEKTTAPDQMMAILGDWIVRYGQTEVK